ncbi:hypothetical protein SCHPADRAFT_410995 [Schizopora paradoxa]|uniref:MYND-type domain-containing protein n=1 Tax=Schizopora paradoxa TaxID=27342 RepID=A0A0H2RKN5_9AGAM|nr:hypothetical protein SCHPADRAFT_410995 [Schizopora paradoxa]
MYFLPLFIPPNHFVFQCHVRMHERMLKKCSRCKFVLYCSQDCQTKDWKMDHKQNCKVYAKNLEAYRRKADTEHFFDHLVRSDIYLA